MRWVAVAAACCLWTDATLADVECRNDALAVLQNGTISGPYRFESRTQHPNLWVVRQNGVIVPPDKTSVKIGDDDLEKYGKEEIQIGRLHWSRVYAESRYSEWTVTDLRDGSVRLVPSSDRVGTVRCLGEVFEDGRRYIAYEYDVNNDVDPKWAGKPASIWRVLTEPSTKLPIKIGRRNGIIRRDELDPVQAETIETRTYDASLKVEPPDRKESWPKYVEQFSAAVLQANSECGKAAQSTFRTALASGPFRIERSSEGKVFLRITVVPPDRMRVESPGGEEVVFADYQVWSRSHASEWRSAVDTGHAFALHYALTMKNILPVEAFPDDVKCLGEIRDEGRPYIAYEYMRTEYKYLHGYEGQKGVIRTMLVDRVTGLPYKFEDRDPNGSWRRTARWFFDPSLKVEPPVLADKK